LSRTQHTVAESSIAYERIWVLIQHAVDESSIAYERIWVLIDAHQHHLGEESLNVTPGFKDKTRHTLYVK
jgi:hypothetical protein